jgi:hypothetical protein
MANDARFADSRVFVDDGRWEDQAGGLKAQSVEQFGVLLPGRRFGYRHDSHDVIASQGGEGIAPSQAGQSVRYRQIRILVNIIHVPKNVVLATEGGIENARQASSADEDELWNRGILHGHQCRDPHAEKQRAA